MKHALHAEWAKTRMMASTAWPLAGRLAVLCAYATIALVLRRRDA